MRLTGIAKVAIVVACVMLVVEGVLLFARHARDVQRHEAPHEEVALVTDGPTLVMTDGMETTISEAGTYVVRGAAHNATLVVDVGPSQDVVIVLDGLEVESDEGPAIEVVSASSVRLATQKDSDNSLVVHGPVKVGNLDQPAAAVRTAGDLELSGAGELTLESPGVGVGCGGSLFVEDGSLSVVADEVGLQAKRELRMDGGEMTIEAPLGLKAQEAELAGGTTRIVATMGINAHVVTLSGGTNTIEAVSQGIRAPLRSNGDDSDLCIDVSGGTNDISTTADHGCVLGTGGFVHVSGGTNFLCAKGDDSHVVMTTGRFTLSGGESAIIAEGSGSTALRATRTLEISGGTSSIATYEEDSSALRSVTRITISGGTTEVSSANPFVPPSKAEKTGGTLILNGEPAERVG